MINRRHIRVKVMQSVYAMLHSQNEDLIREEKFLKHSIRKMYDLYVLMILLLVEVQKLANQQLELSKKKHLATKEDLKPNTKFINNKLLHIIAKSESLNNYVDANKVDNWYLEQEYVKILWKQLQDSDLYKNYMSTTETTYKEDCEFVLEFYKTIIAPNEKISDYFEDENITWSDDIPFVNTWVVKSLSKQKEEGIFVLGKLYKDADDQEFVSDLFRKTVLHHISYELDIKDKTPNWETDRIASMDMILIKMGISEFLKFPSIPVRVTINEYIEIAKDYSTEKSGYFINGVLDKLSKDYIEEKKIEKLGRGLL